MPSSRLNAATQNGQEKDELTPFEDVTTYNNFYEFGTDKSDPAENAKGFKTKPWTVKVEGLVSKPASYSIEDFIKPSKLRGARLSASLRRGMVHGDPVAGLPDVGSHQPRAAAVVGASSSSSRR